MAPAISNLVHRILDHPGRRDPLRLPADPWVQNRAHSAYVRHLCTGSDIGERKAELDKRRDVRKPTPHNIRILNHDVVTETSENMRNARRHFRMVLG